MRNIAKLKEKYAHRPFRVGYIGYPPFVERNGKVSGPLFEAMFSLGRELGDVDPEPIECTWQDFARKLLSSDIDVISEPVMEWPLRRKVDIVPYCKIKPAFFVCRKQFADQLRWHVAKIQELLPFFESNPESHRLARHEVRDIGNIGSGLAVSEGTVSEFILVDLFMAQKVLRRKGTDLRAVALGACRGNRIFLTAFPTAREIVSKEPDNYEYVEFMPGSVPAGIAIGPDNDELYQLLKEYDGIDAASQKLNGSELEEMGIVLVRRRAGEVRGVLPLPWLWPHTPESLVKKHEWTHLFRTLWTRIPRSDIKRRTTLAIVHGIVERSSELSLQQAEAWLSGIERKIIAGSHRAPKDVEAEARELNCGLHVLDSERDPESVLAFFGVVQSVEEGVADISIYAREAVQDSRAPVLEAVQVPEVDLPAAYARPGVWVAWVERQYKCGTSVLSKGRFEPAGSLPQDDRATAVEYSPRLIEHKDG